MGEVRLEEGHFSFFGTGIAHGVHVLGAKWGFPPSSAPYWPHWDKKPFPRFYPPVGGSDGNWERPMKSMTYEPPDPFGNASGGKSLTH